MYQQIFWNKPKCQNCPIGPTFPLLYCLPYNILILYWPMFVALFLLSFPIYISNTPNRWMCNKFACFLNFIPLFLQNAITVAKAPGYRFFPTTVAQQEGVEWYFATSVLKDAVIQTYLLNAKNYYIEIDSRGEREVYQTSRAKLQRREENFSIVSKCKQLYHTIKPFVGF